MEHQVECRIAAALEGLLEVQGERRDIENQALDTLREIQISLTKILSQPVGFTIKEAVVSVGDDARTTVDRISKNIAAQIRTAANRPPTDLKGAATIMTPLKATGADLQILDDGKGVLYTLTPVNHAGQPEPLPANTPPIVATSSAPASLANAVPDPGDPNATPPRPPDTTGLVFLATVPTPVVDATGITMAFETTLPGGQTLQATADPVDVVADSSPVGFTISETAL